MKIKVLTVLFCVASLLLLMYSIIPERVIFIVESNYERSCYLEKFEGKSHAALMLHGKSLVAKLLWKERIFPWECK